MPFLLCNLTIKTRGLIVRHVLIDCSSNRIKHERVYEVLSWGMEDSVILLVTQCSGCITVNLLNNWILTYSYLCVFMLELAGGSLPPPPRIWDF